MSVALLLVPLAVAAATATQAALGQRTDGTPICQVRTRMRDETLLAEALRDTGATVRTADGRLIAEWTPTAIGVTCGAGTAKTDTRATFARDTGRIWSAHFTGVSQEQAVALVTAVDEAYGRQVQRAVVTRLRERAPAAGLRLESESAGDDASVRLVFEVERESR